MPTKSGAIVVGVDAPDACLRALAWAVDQVGRVSRMLFGSVSVAAVEHASCRVAVVPTVLAD